MKVENITITIKKPACLTTDSIESEIKKHGEPLRWAIVKVKEPLLSINAVMYRNEG